jgi:hypothetical protein
MRQKSCAGAFHGEKSQRADTQIFASGGGNVPEGDTGGLKASDDIRQPQTLVLSKKGKIPELGL